MEGLVEAYLKKSGVEYYREMYLSEIEQKWNISLQYRGYKQGRGLF